MTVMELEARVMFQSNNDVDDLSDYLPYLSEYLNEAYDQLLLALEGRHLDDAEYLSTDTDTPSLLPGWSHVALADYATWCVYRNSNPVKQQRGMQFYQAFLRIEARLRAEALKGVQFYNVD